jgi:hypothetical protein
MFCSCMSKFRHEGQPGGCDACRRSGTVYDENGIHICLYHDVITLERTAAKTTTEMQCRFKMEYRLFTIVRYNYRDYNNNTDMRTWNNKYLEANSS